MIIVPLMKNISVANMTKASISVSVHISASLGKRSKDWNHGTSRSESVSCVKRCTLNLLSHPESPTAAVPFYLPLATINIPGALHWDFGLGLVLKHSLF